MLYTTTRSDLESFTPERALKERFAPDGGLYIPMKLQPLGKEQIRELMNRSSAGIMAEIMNLFFPCKLSEKDVQFLLGKELARLTHMSHRITVAECWRNPDGDFARIQRILAPRIAVDKRSVPVGEWLQVAVRIGLLFVLYSQMVRDRVIEYGTKLDIAMLSQDFCGPMAGWYARCMGLPIDTVVCCCNENGAPWDLINQGSLKTDVQMQSTSAPKCDVARPAGLERLVRETVGLAQAQRYAQCCEQGSRYELNAVHHGQLSSGMYACVTSDKRLPRVIANTYATKDYILCPYSALMYAGLMDYRAATGKNSPAVIVCEISPLQSEDTIAAVLGIPASQLHEKLDVVI